MTETRLPKAIPLTKEQFVKVKKLIAHEPCDYLVDKKYCAKADAGLPCPCMQMADNCLECNHFTDYVLRGYPELFAEIVGGSIEGSKSSTGSTKVCAMCGGMFKSASPGAKYCPSCRLKATRQKARERKRRQRGV